MWKALDLSGPSSAVYIRTSYTPLYNPDSNQHNNLWYHVTMINPRAVGEELPGSWVELHPNICGKRSTVQPWFLLRMLTWGKQCCWAPSMNLNGISPKGLTVMVHLAFRQHKTWPELLNRHQIPAAVDGEQPQSEIMYVGKGKESKAPWENSSWI